MCRDYKDFGSGSVIAGIVFFAISFFFGFNPVRIAIIIFFAVLGVVDLLLYERYGAG